MKFTRRRAFRKTKATGGGFSAKLNTSPFFDTGAEPSFFAAQAPTPAISRKCESCEQEEKAKKLQREGNSRTSSTAPVSVSSYVTSLNGKGSPLPTQTKHFFEPKFKADFSQVRVHDNDQSAEMASAIHAKAFTHRNNIVFNKGAYNTESSQGKQLLAHELTHVVQQDNSISRMEVEKVEEEKLQRVPAPHSDFIIRGITPDAASVSDTIYFDFASAHLIGSERDKLTALAAPPARSLTLTGTISEEGDAAFNATLLNNRIGNVNSGLRVKGHTGPRIPNPQPGVTSGNKDYRKQRAVEVIETPGVVPPGGVMPGNVPACDAGFVVPCPALIIPYLLSLFWLNKASGKVSSGSPDALAQAGILFPGIPLATINDNLSKLTGQMALLPRLLECHNECDGACERPANNSGVGATSKMTLCPSFQTQATDEQAETFLHESLHATPGVATDDIAYGTTRLLESLTGAQAIKNTDSYVLLILRLAGVAPMPSPVPPVDTFAGLSGPEELLIRPAMAFLEQWLLNCEFDTGLLYDAVDKNIGKVIAGVARWDPAFDWHAKTIHDINAHFGLTDPGAASPFLTTPVDSDKWIMAGVYHRYNRMMRAIYQQNINFSKMPVGLGRWTAGMGPSAQIGNPFFVPALTPVDRVKYLMNLLAKSAPGEIPSSRLNAYIESADVIRKGRGTGP